MRFHGSAGVDQRCYCAFVSEISNPGAAEEFCARVHAATAGTLYQLQRTRNGFDLTIEVSGPLLAPHGVTRMCAHQVVLRSDGRSFTMTDVVRVSNFQGTRGGFQTGVAQSRGRQASASWSWRPGDGLRKNFSTADGHRLVRDAAAALGWQEVKPTAAKVGLVFAVIGGVGAIAALVAVAIVNWL